MANQQVYELIPAGIDCHDVFTPAGRFAGLVAKRPDGSWRHYYDSNATRFSKQKFRTISEALENLHTRREKRIATRAS